MLLKPYNQIDKYKEDPYSQTYQGQVVDNKDPEKLKRIKVNIPIWEDYTDDDLQWVCPFGDASASPNSDKHNIPSIGSIVTVSFNNKNPEDPRYSGAGITTDTKCSLFDEDYPDTYGEKDDIGNMVMHNKKTGVSLFRHNSGTEIQMDPDGSFMVMGKTGAYAAIDSSGNMRLSGSSLTFVADEDINISGQRVNIHAESLLNLSADFIEQAAKSGITSSSWYHTFTGAIMNLETQEVKVAKTLTIESSPSFSYFDPFSKAYVDFSKGVLVSKVYAGNRRDI